MPLTPDSYVPPTPPKVTSIGEVALNPAAPLSPVQPSTNPVMNAAIGLGPAAAVNLATNAVAGPEVPLIAGALNVFLSWLKNRRWFPEEHTTLLLIVLSFVVCFVVWRFFFDDIHRGVVNAFGVIVNAHTNYQAAQVSGVGLLSPTREENRWHPKV